MLTKNNKNKFESASSGNILNIIGPESHIKGDLHCGGDTRIDGRIDGNVVSRSKVVMGENSQITGTLTSKNADIYGKISGDIQITEVLFLRATANVDGDIKTNQLVIESGAVFNGKCLMGKVAESVQKPGSTTKPSISES